MPENNNLPEVAEKKNMPDVMVGARGYLVPNSIDTQWRMAVIYSKSGLAPTGMEKPETLFTAIQLGAEVGLPSMQAIQSIAVINGRPTIWGDAQLALIKAHPDYEYIKEYIEGSGDDMQAVCELKRRTELVATIQTFSVEDAKRAGLWQTEAKVTRKNKSTGSTYQKDNDSPWYRYPKRMLQMRARAFACRDAFPDVLKGLSVTREEAIDLVESAPGTYAAPEVEQVQEAIDKTKKQSAPKMPEASPAEVDMETGEVTTAPSDPWARENWIRLRSVGFKKFVKENISILPDEIMGEVRHKWANFYPGESFPKPNMEAEPPAEPDEVLEQNQAGLLLTDKNGEPMKSCPDRNGDRMYESYCEEECPVREGCPAWEN